MLVPILFAIFIGMLVLSATGYWYSEQEGFRNNMRSNSHPYNYVNTQLPKCECPHCVLARTADTSLPQLDQLQCVKNSNSGGPIELRNTYNEWASASMSPWSVPVNGYDFGFYKF